MAPHKFASLLATVVVALELSDGFGWIPSARQPHTIPVLFPYPDPHPSLFYSSGALSYQIIASLSIGQWGIMQGQGGRGEGRHFSMETISSHQGSTVVKSQSS